MLKPSGHRLDDKHNLIIKKYAKKWKVKEAIALRNIIINFDEEIERQKEHEQTS